MRLEGIHHITAITGDAPGNVDFYARVLGLRLVKKTVNQDDPTVYHLFYADEKGSPGSDITFFEYPGARRGQAGDGMVHRVIWRVASEEALDFWATRLGAEGIDVARTEGSLTFADPEGLGLELVVAETADDPLIAESPEIPSELALQGFHGVRAYSSQPDRSRSFLEEALGFESRGDTAFEARGEQRGSLYEYDATDDPAIPGAGTVHHVAWSSPPEEHEAWRQRVAGGRRLPDAGHRPLLLQVDLLPRAERRAVRDRDDGPRLHRRRAARDPRRAPLPAAELRAAPRPGRACSDAAAESARGLGGQELTELLEARVRPAAGEPEGALVLFHGRGTDENDLQPLLDALDPERRLLGVTPRGPLLLPPGGHHWYVIRELGFPDPETFLGSYERASAWLDAPRCSAGANRDRRLLPGRGDELRARARARTGRARPASSP